ncbi:CTP synthase [Candidatus Parcubacteria bacterium]|nr:MAG: CTP synthase [Candidatus Parcubacteria bacterium]
MPPKTKYIFITGGVCSGLGKGIASASIGAILKSSGYSVFTCKLDPYLNIDPGTMSPYQHGEVFVTDDGTETDLDLGHYERFIDTSLSRLSNITTGRVYEKVLQGERTGHYLGKTIQIVPHITNEIKDYVRKAAKESKADFLLLEIGGTVGDIEGEPFLEALRQFHNEMGDENVMFVHLTLLPYLVASRELKTKPTQMSVRELHRRGIQPDIILTRSDLKVGKDELEKIAMFADVDRKAVIPALTVKTIYEVPLIFEKHNISEIIFEKLKLPKKKPNLSEWKSLVSKIKKTRKKLPIALVGKYNENIDAYISVVEAIKSACYHNNAKLDLLWINSGKLEKKDKKEMAKLKKAAGIIVPGGFGNRGVEGKIMAAKYARENNKPYLGLCLGMQVATIEFARHILETQEVDSTEFDSKTPNPVIHILPGHHKDEDMGGTLRLGAYPCVLDKDSLSYKAYGTNKISERHRHRYEFNNDYREQLEKGGMRFAGLSPDKRLVEIIELRDHPFFVASQFHPEFKSRPLRPHPLFRDFIKTSVKLIK